MFWKKGCHATSINDLVDHLGVNRASLYTSFKGGKDEIFQKAFEKYRNENIERVQQFLEDQSEVKKGFLQLFENSIDHALSDSANKGCFMVNATTELANSNAFIAEISGKNREVFEAMFLHFLQKGVAQGEISKGKDLKGIAAMLYVLQNGLQVAKSNPPKEQLMNRVHTSMSVLD